MSRTKRTVKKRARPARQAAATTAGVVAIEASDAIKARALVKFRELGTVSAACEAAGIGRRTWYDWMEADQAFAKAVLEATEDVTDDLEKEAIRRAKDGSDTLVIFLLKSRRRAQYGDRLTLEVASPEVQARLVRQAEVVSSRETWTSEELLNVLDKVWT